MYFDSSILRDDDIDNDGFALIIRYHCFRIVLIFYVASIVDRTTRLVEDFEITPLFLARYQPRGRIVNRKPECRNEYHQDEICATCDGGSLGWTRARLTFLSDNEWIVFPPQLKLLSLLKCIKVNARTASQSCTLIKPLTENTAILRHLSNKR